VEDAEDSAATLVDPAVDAEDATFVDVEEATTVDATGLTSVLVNDAAEELETGTATGLALTVAEDEEDTATTEEIAAEDVAAEEDAAIEDDKDKEEDNSAEETGGGGVGVATPAEEEIPHRSATGCWAIARADKTVTVANMRFM